MKLFFLVDGIDEYQQDNNKDGFTGIIEFFVNKLGTSANTKALVSSRPLEAFDRLGIRPQLILYNLNHQDIESYVIETLGNQASFQAAKAIDKKNADLIVRHILKHVTGVFL